MEPEEQNDRIFDNPTQVVVVSIPEQENKIRVKLKLNPLVWEEGMKDKPEVFMPYRLVINPEFHNEDTDELLEEFDPPITFYINYTATDKETAEANNKPLKIAKWKDNQWKIISHELADDPTLLGDGVAGVFRFQIKSWGEPSIGIGE